MKNTVGTIIVIVAAVVAVLGMVLPFYSVGAVGMTMSASLLFPEGIGIVALIWLLLTIVAVVCAIAGKKILTAIFAVLAGAGLALSFFLNNGDFSQYESFGVEVVKGLGYWCSIVGAVLMVVAGIVYVITSKDSTASAE